MSKIEFTEQYPWASVFLWSSGISIGVSFLMWLRVDYADTLLSSKADEMIYFMPHILIIIFGAILGILNKNNKDNRINLTQQPFLSVWMGVLIFSVTLSLWTARPNHFVSDRLYIDDVFSNMALSFLIALFWIVIPFFIGYSVTRFIQYVINYRYRKK